MAVYLYNALFSLNGADCGLGRFAPYNGTMPNPTITTQSSAWFTYQLPGTPFNLGDYFTPVSTALNPGDWANSVSDGGSLALNPGDFLMMRVASVDSGAGQYLARFSAVFGRGSGQIVVGGGGDLQSPLQMNTATMPSSYPRAVIDVDGTSGSSWPAPIASDNSWVNWLGAVHSDAGVANDYTVNVGMSVYVLVNGVGSNYTFGKDPRLRVGGMARHKKHDGDCAA